MQERRAERATYDHRIRAEVVSSGNLALASDLGIPRSTVGSWLVRGVPANVVALPDDELDRRALRIRLRRHERRTRVLVAVVLLLKTLLTVVLREGALDRLTDVAAKKRLVRAIERASRAIPRRAALRVLGLSAARVREWSSAAELCGLQESPRCPRSQPGRLTPSEIAAMREMVTSEDFRAFSLRGLALHAQRIGRLFASPTTWSRLVKAKGWRRPTRHVHPPSPAVGVRAERPNQIWHVDVTIIRLLDGTKVFVQAVLDNFSRKLLAHRVSPSLDPAATATLLRDAGERFLPERALRAASPAEVVCDAGIENVNRYVDAVLPDLGIRRVLALVDVEFSNSMIEAFWKSLKHRCLFLHSMTSIEVVRRLVDEYVRLHNAVLAHAAFRGQTPDEVFAGKAQNLHTELEVRRAAAREERLMWNRRARCGTCRSTDATSESSMPPELLPV